MLRTGHLLHPASNPASRPRTGASLPGTLASPRTGLAPAGCPQLVAWLRHNNLLAVMAPKLLDALPERRDGDTGLVLLIDAANVIGSRPTGWWRDRPGAARAFVERVRAAAAAGRFAEPLVVVLEGAARGGVDEGVADGVRVLHALGSGDDMLIAVATDAAGQVTLVSADRALRQRAEAPGARVASPGWLIDLLDA